MSSVMTPLKDERPRRSAAAKPGPSGTISIGEPSVASVAVGRVKALMRQEAYRLLTVREGDKVKRMPALQAVLRSRIACAAKGNVPAQRVLVKAMQEMDTETGARRTGAPHSCLGQTRRIDAVRDMSAHAQFRAV